MRLTRLIAYALCALMISGCSVRLQDEPQERYVFAMDTEMTLRAYGVNAKKALDEAVSEINRLDAALDRGDAGSEIYRINSSGGGTVSDDTAAIIQTALDVSRSTDGAFDMTIAPVMDLWGFYTGEYNVPSQSDIAEALDRVDYGGVTLSGNSVALENGVTIDLGGIAKGYLSSKITDIMKENGVTSAIVSLGGNVHVLGTRPDSKSWRVAIQDPDGGGYAGIVGVRDKAVITSGGYQRFFERDGVTYHHIIDPSTGLCARSGLKSVSVISGDGAVADALSTALFVMGEDGALSYWRDHGGFDAVLITDDGRTLITGGIGDSFESDGGYTVIYR